MFISLPRANCCLYLLWTNIRGPFHWQFFHHNSNVIEKSFYSLPKSNKEIATNFCTWQDNCVDMACEENCCDMLTIDWMTARRRFHRFWIASKIALAKRAPGSNAQNHFALKTKKASRHHKDGIYLSNDMFRSSHDGIALSVRISPIKTQMSFILYWVKG